MVLKKLVTVGEAAEMLGVGRTKAWKLVGTGELNSIKLVGSRRVSLDAIDRYIAKMEADSWSVGDDDDQVGRSAA